MDNFEDKLNSVLSDPEAMEKIMNMARSLGSGQSPENSGGGDGEPSRDGGESGLAGLLPGAEGLPSIDPALMGKLMHLWTVYNKGNDPQKLAVLHAVKPYLHPERQERVDRALQTLRLAHVAREVLGADLFSSIFGTK